MARVFKDETRHSTRRSRVLKVGTRHRPVKGVSPAMTSWFRSGWLISTGLQFDWTALDGPSNPLKLSYAHHHLRCCQCTTLSSTPMHLHSQFNQFKNFHHPSVPISSNYTKNNNIFKDKNLHNEALKISISHLDPNVQCRPKESYQCQHYSTSELQLTCYLNA